MKKQTKANDIKNKITNPSISVPFGTNTSTIDVSTIKVIKTALQTANHLLTFDDLTKITFANVTLSTSAAVKVTAIITVGTYPDTKTATIDLMISIIAETAQQKANAIKEKIRNKNITVAKGTAVSTTDPATITTIKTSLNKWNPTLTTDDLTKITFANVTLSTSAAVNVTTTVTVDTKTAVTDLLITLAAT